MTLFTCSSSSRIAASILGRRCPSFSPYLQSHYNSRLSTVVGLSKLCNMAGRPLMTVPTRHPFSSAAASAADAVTSTPSIGQALAKLAEERPEMDVVRYHHKNVKWSFKHVEFFSDCLATGFLDMGLAPGDVVLSWLPSHFSEQVSKGTRNILSFILILLCQKSLC